MLRKITGIVRPNEELKNCGFLPYELDVLYKESLMREALIMKAKLDLYTLLDQMPVIDMTDENRKLLILLQTELAQHRVELT